MNSKSSNQNWLEDTRTDPVENQMFVGNQMTLNELAEYGQETEPTEEEDIGTEQDPESDSDEEQREEPVV